MVFSSLTFLCLFFPVVLILHQVIPNRSFRNGLLIAASLLFYAFGEPVYVLLMVGSSLVNYVLARLIDRQRRRVWLVLTVVVNIGALIVFKYTGFMVTNFNALTGLSVPVPAIRLPIGISFYTFQALSYVLDVWKGDVKVQKNYAKVLLYISFFPQLIAGPIVRYRDIEEEIDNREVDLRQTAFGLRRFIGGLAKKVLIADAMGAAADFLFTQGAANLNVLGAWIGAIAYLMQIYFDFSAYSDMAIGLGKMFGFHFKENFLYPYRAATMQDFWRRWHVSLSSWFRDYLYIPLGGSRKGKGRAALNRVIVFFLTGLWHGANWTFIVWGLFHGAFLMLETYVPKIKKIPAALGHVYTLLVVTVGFVIFRADTLGEGVRFIGKMFSGFDFSAPAMSGAIRVLTPFFGVMLVLAVVGSCFMERTVTYVRSLEGAAELSKKERVLQIATFAAAFVLLAWCILRLTGSSYHPFIYFRF